jgi:hypothetical protein
MGTKVEEHRKCFFDPDKNTHTHTNYFFHMTLPTVEGIMRHINVYRNVDTNEPMEVPLHFQFYFYYYRPYVLLDDLRNLDPNCVGLLALNKQNEKVS